MSEIDGDIVSVRSDDVDRLEGAVVPLFQTVGDHDIKLDMLADKATLASQAIRDVESKADMAIADLYGRIGELSGAVEGLQDGTGYEETELIAPETIGPKVQFKINQTRNGLGYLYWRNGSNYTCRVYAGSLRILGVGNYAVAQTDVVLAAASTGDAYWIYATIDLTASPPAATATGSVTEPTSTAAVINYPLYKFIKNSDGSYYLSRILHWGDATMGRHVIPDAQVTGTAYKSTDWQSNGALGLYDFPNAPDDTPNSYTKIVARVWDGVQAIEVGYITADALAQWLADESSAIFWADADWTTAASTWLATGVVKHTDLNFADSGTVGTGESGGNTDHDDAYWHTYNDGVHANYIDGKDYRTTGEVRADDFIVNDSTANSWNAEAFTADVTGAASLIADGNVVLNAGATLDIDVTGALDMDVTAASTADFANDFTMSANLLYLHPKTSGVSTLAIGAAGYRVWKNVDIAACDWVAIAGKDINVYGDGTGSLLLGSALAGAGWANIYYNGVAGVDIANWTTKGGLTGTGIVERSVSNLQPNDKVLVIPG